MKKVLDKPKTMCYSVKDAPRRRVRSMKSRTAFHIGCGSSDVPCKLNNEKHEQTPWTILIEKNKVVLKCQCRNIAERTANENS